MRSPGATDRRPHVSIGKGLLFAAVFLFALGSSAAVRVTPADAVPVGAGAAALLGVAAIAKR